jgi:hypothetical protein
MKLRVFFAILAAAWLAGSAHALGGEPGEEPSPGEARAEEKQLKAGDRDPEFLEKVNDAIRKGVECVKSAQLEDGSWDYTHDFSKENWHSGCTALCLLTLLKSGVNRNDECIEKGFAWLRKQPFKRTYEVGLTLMAIEARWVDEKLEDRVRGLTEAEPAKKPGASPTDVEWMKAAVAFLLNNTEVNSRNTSTGAAVGEKEVWGYPRTGREARNSYADHSNTQFALLGLKSAARCGIRFPNRIWKTALAHFLRMQEETGPKVQRVQMLEDREHGYVSYKTVSRVEDTARGWGYSATLKPRWSLKNDAFSTTGSMTAAGVAAVILCLSELGADVDASARPKAQKAVLDGLAWLDKNFTVETNPGHYDGGWLYYYLYAIERAAVLAKARHIGKHDWYREGATFLIEHQAGGGSWDYKGYSGPLPDTCLALLFLTKATAPVDVKITGR